MRKILSFLVGSCMALAILLPTQLGVKEVKAYDVGQSIDMYLLAGGSNALGQSLHNGELTDTYENVGYASGETAFADFKWSVQAGYGASDTQVGPEYGMAQVLNEGGKAFIFKSAASDSSLYDMNDKGNWFPRSMWDAGHDPIASNKTTGHEYASFINGFETVYAELVDNGYQPQIKGMVWMQGENDLSMPKLYKELIKIFITDIREDLVEITGDESLTTMPFIMGKVPTTVGEYNNAAVPAFNEMQDKVATEMENVATVDTSDLIIVNEDGSINGTDAQHLNAKDAETLGVRFGEKLREYGKRSSVSTAAENGKVAYTYDSEDNLVFTFTPDKNHKLQSVVINGVERIAEVIDDELVVENHGGNVDVKATFTELAKYYVSYENVGEYEARFVSKAQYCYEGKVLKVKLDIKEGYEVISVKFNDIEMEYNKANGCYEIIPTEHGHVSVSIQEPVEEASFEEEVVAQNEEDTSESSTYTAIASSISISSIALLTLMGAAYAVYKRRH